LFHGEKLMGAKIESRTAKLYTTCRKFPFGFTRVHCFIFSTMQEVVYKLTFTLHLNLTISHFKKSQHAI